jgi:hypothetical protein
MSARLGVKAFISRGQRLWKPSLQSPRVNGPICLFCSLSRVNRPVVPTRRKTLWTRRAETTLVEPTTAGALEARKNLENALFRLQKHGRHRATPSQLQLALRNLREEPGQESVTIAITAVDADLSALQARRLLRLVLADPLTPEQAWEKELLGHNDARPLLVHVDEAAFAQKDRVGFVTEKPYDEVYVASPNFNGKKVSFLIGHTHPGTHTTPLTPVHKTIYVGAGLRGLADAISTSRSAGPSTHSEIAVDLQVTPGEEDGRGFDGFLLQMEKAEQGLNLIRQNIGNAIQYQHLWDKSGLGTVSMNLMTELSQLPQSGSTKFAVSSAIRHVLSQLNDSLSTNPTRDTPRLPSSREGEALQSTVNDLNQGLSEWAKDAHEELQAQLDLAFTGRRWRKLGWWKLFWRVDDVGMLSADMISQRFLPESERGIIYFTGRVKQAGIVAETTDGPIYDDPAPAENGIAKPETPKQAIEGRWPTHIPFTRNYLLETTVPSLQALAHKLVAQSLGTSAVTSSLGVLMWFSSFGIYESGAVAALGIVWSLRRLQHKWETARQFWESEVREEGRKAVRATESSVANILDGGSKSQGTGLVAVDEAQQLLKNAWTAYKAYLPDSRV